MKATPVKAKIIVAEDYICHEHGLWKGRKVDAIPHYTSTKKLKGYIVMSPKKGTKVYLNTHEIQILRPLQMKTLEKYSTLKQIELSPEDEALTKACELLHGVDFTTEEDMLKAVTSVSKYIESSRLQTDKQVEDNRPTVDEVVRTVIQTSTQANERTMDVFVNVDKLRTALTKLLK